MRVLKKMVILFYLFLLGYNGLGQHTIDFPFDISGKDTLETWQGVRYILVKENPNGTIPKKGSKIYVYYRGTLENGSVFDENTKDRSPFVFRLGKMEVIKGWDIVFEKLKYGEQARLIIPWKYAYGKFGNPPEIPRKANLVFDVYIVGVE